MCVGISTCTCVCMCACVYSCWGGVSGWLQVILFSHSLPSFLRQGHWAYLSVCLPSSDRDSRCVLEIQTQILMPARHVCCSQSHLHYTLGHFLGRIDIILLTSITSASRGLRCFLHSHSPLNMMVGPLPSRCFLVCPLPPLAKQTILLCLYSHSLNQDFLTGAWVTLKQRTWKTLNPACMMAFL